MAILGKQSSELEREKSQKTERERERSRNQCKNLMGRRQAAVDRKIPSGLWRIVWAVFCFGTGNGYLISSLTVAPVDTDNRLVFHGYFVGIETIIRCRILDLQHKLECQKGRATQYRDIIWIRDEL